MLRGLHLSQIRSLPSPYPSHRRCPRPTGLILDKVQQELLTPYGLRTLAPSHPAYKGVFTALPMKGTGPTIKDGLPYLIGPFVEAYVKISRLRSQGQDFRPPNPYSPSWTI